jgi:hypothetical protein
MDCSYAHNIFYPRFFCLLLSSSVFYPCFIRGENHFSVAKGIASTQPLQSAQILAHPEKP